MHGASDTFPQSQESAFNIFDKEQTEPGLINAQCPVTVSSKKLKQSLHN